MLEKLEVRNKCIVQNIGSFEVWCWWCHGGSQIIILLKCSMNGLASGFDGSSDLLMKLIACVEIRNEGDT